MTNLTSLFSKNILISVVLFPLICFSQNQGNQIQTSGGEVTFTFRTVSTGGTYSPKHVLAVWVEDAAGFVKTRLLRANSKKQYLYTWKASSNYNVVDAVTGATMTSHQTHTATWNCTDLEGNIIPDGDYDIWAEFTDKHAQGPLKTITFTKSPEPQTITLSDETYFKDMSVVFTPYVADFAVDVTHICEDGSVTFTDNSTNAASWEWDFGDFAYPPTADTQGPHTVIYSAPGLKTVTLTINGNIVETKTDFINVDSIPTAGFTYEIDDLTVEFSNTSTNAIDYLWDFGDGETSTDVNPAHTYNSPGTFIVTLTASDNYCSDAIFTQNVAVDPFSIDDISATSFVIYPNPGNGIFTLRMDSKVKGASEINIYNQNGSELFTYKSASIENESFTIDLTSFNKGVYFVKLTTENKILFRKLIVI